MNLVLISGRLTKDPEVRYTTGTQMAVAVFTLAIDRGKDKNGEDMGADFPRVTVFGKQAENCERYLAKGCRVAVQGKIQTGSYEDKNGQKVFTTDVIAQRVEFIDFKEKTPQNANQSAYNDNPPGYSSLSEDDIPFA